MILPHFNSITQFIRTIVKIDPIWGILQKLSVQKKEVIGAV